MPAHDPLAYLSGPPLATTWVSKTRPAKQLAKFIREMAQAYMSVDAQSPNSPRLLKLLEAYYRTRRPALGRLTGAVELSDLKPSTMARIVPRPGAGAQTAVQTRAQIPVVDIQLSRMHYPDMTPRTVLEALGHEGMHGAQHWRHSRQVRPEEIANAPWYWDAYDKYGPYDNPFEAQARAAGETSARDFSRFMAALSEAVGSNALTGLEGDLAADILRALGGDPGKRPKGDVPPWLVQGFIMTGRRSRYNPFKK